MSQVHYYLNEIINFLKTGFHDGFAHVNAILGLIIALIAAYMLPNLKRIWAITLGATIIHLIAEVMLPVLDRSAEFRMPPDFLEMSYWRAAIALYLGYLVVIAVFYFIKKRVLPGGGGH